MSKIALDSSYSRKLAVRRALYEERDPTALQAEMLGRALRYRYQDLVAESMRRHLTFEEAFAAACYALRASNADLDRRFFQGLLPSFGEVGDLIAAREMLSGLAMKEAWNHLTPDEIAGMVTATMLDVVRFPDYGERVLETCGMGGDRGVRVNGWAGHRKTINGSTLSALVLAALGVKTAKHGSYSNTSAVGATNAIEQLGVDIDRASVEAQQQVADGLFHFTDAHAWKTIHDLSHVQPRRETVNHVIGPMTPPVGPRTRIDKVIGVNEKLHPGITAKTWEVLCVRGVFKVGNVAAVCGLGMNIEDSEHGMHQKVRDLVVLDELSPFASVVSFCQNGVFAGTHILRPSDFGWNPKNPYSVFIENENDAIMSANRAVLVGQDDGRELVGYLAMNAALALYLVECMDDDVDVQRNGPNRDALRACHNKCLSALQEGRVQAFLDSLIG